MIIMHNSNLIIKIFNTSATSANKRSMIAGSISTMCEAEDEIKFPEPNVMEHILVWIHVAN